MIFLSDLATVEVVCKRGDELLTKTFLLDNGRLKLASLLTVFDLKYVELVLGEFSMLLSWYYVQKSLRFFSKQKKMVQSTGKPLKIG